ncbi:MAG: hypothetical protein LBH16_03780 [Treponema sp.]|jgi:hypothetical protein|nr:hypothetical protein [Treponema sp.]
MIYEKTRDLLLQETQLVKEAAGIQEKIRDAVFEREWTDFENQINAMNSIENQLAGLESEREQLFNVYETLTRKNALSGKADSKGRFYAIAAVLPEKQRSDLTALYRALKLDSIKLKLANETFLAYLGGIKSTLKDFFDLAFPESVGKMYTKKGTHFSQDMSSMVLNRSF